jgi:hypothetical protein
MPSVMRLPASQGHHRNVSAIDAEICIGLGEEKSTAMDSTECHLSWTP